MSPKKIKALLIIFVLLLLVVFYPKVVEFAGNKIGFLSKKEDDYSKIMTKISPEEITSIYIEKAGESINIELKNGIWYLDDKKAAQDKVLPFIAGVTSMNVIELASDNPENQASLFVTSQTGHLVKLNNDDNRVFIVGKRGINPGTYYLRKEGSDQTYLVELNISGLTTSTDNWRDKTVINISGKELSEVKLSGNVKSSYSEGAENWDQLIQAFSPLTAFSFMSEDEIAQYNDSKTKTLITLKFKDGSEESMQVFKAKEEYWLGYKQDYFKVTFQALTVLFPD